MNINSYKDLKVWQLSIDIAEQVYYLTQSFPKQEIYGLNSLNSQLQRSAVSIPSNLAEGHTRDSTKEFLHFISIALGSLAELATQLILAQRFKYLHFVAFSVNHKSRPELKFWANSLSPLKWTEILR